MDPNEALRRMRELAARILTDHHVRDDDADDLAAVTQSLDEWITSGGFLPRSWTRAGVFQGAGARDPEVGR